MAKRKPGAGITGVILAGGKGRRMGGKDKGLIEINGNPIVAGVITALAPQVDELIINANRNLEEYRQYGYKVIKDELPDYQGPLAGMLAGLHNAANNRVVFVPCDTANLPHCLVERLAQNQELTNCQVCAAHDGNRLHGVYALLDTSCGDSLRHYLDEGNRKVEDWIMAQNFTATDFSDMPGAFKNINAPDDL